jgi:hypothetical protein
MAYCISHSRWYLKKAARKGLAATAWASGWLAAGESVATAARVRVLTYHRFGESAYDPFCVSPGDFEAQMRYLAEGGLAVSLDDLEAFLAGGKDLPDRAVLVTVDDGFRSVYTEMLPVLREYAVPAVAYATPSLIRDPARPSAPCDASAAEPEEYLTWDELGLLAAGGVTCAPATSRMPRHLVCLPLWHPCRLQPGHGERPCRSRLHHRTDFPARSDHEGRRSDRATADQGRRR